MSPAINTTSTTINPFYERAKQNLKSNWRRILPSTTFGFVAVTAALALVILQPHVGGALILAGLAMTAFSIGLLALGYTVIQLRKEPPPRSIQSRWVIDLPPAKPPEAPAPIRYPAPAPDERQDSHDVPPTPPLARDDAAPPPREQALPIQLRRPERIRVSRPTTWQKAQNLPKALVRKIWNNKVKLLALGVGGYFLYPYLTAASAATAAAAEAPLAAPVAAEIPAAASTGWFGSLSQITTTLLLGLFLQRRAAQA